MAKKSLDTVSMTELHKELKRRERMMSFHMKKLTQKREKLVSQVADIDAELTKFGVATGRLRAVGAGRKRPRNDSNLADALAGVLKNATMSVTEVAEAVQTAGYQTTSPNFRTIVNQTLIKDTRFKRVGRGRYTVK